MIEISHIVKTFNKTIALDKISLAIRNNTIFGFVGPNGAGKSTMVNILTGIIKKTSGNISIMGFNIDKEPMEIKKIIGVIPEMLALFDGLTGHEYLNFVSRIYGLKYDEYDLRINELIEYFELYSAKDRLIETYSQGMKKKIAFAASIIHTPKILFLDEPFESIDPISRKKMKDVLKKMWGKGSTLFITSHALAEVEDFCDEVAIINKGKIVYQSETKDIRNKIKNEVTKETYQSLEDIFIDLTTDKDENEKTLSWI
jgi:ABC-2 type transport system ATP-binding protein